MTAWQSVVDPDVHGTVPVVFSVHGPAGVDDWYTEKAPPSDVCATMSNPCPTAV